MRWIVVSPTALSAMPASAIVPPSIHTAAEAAAIAQSPARRSTFSCALPPPGRSGTRTSVSSSPSPTAVMYGPTWKSSIPTTRSPSAPRITTFALTAEQTADRSSAASAWQSEPPIVPRLRTTGSAITFSASRKSGKCSASSSDFSRSTWRVSAPIRDLAVLLADVGELGEVVDVDQVLGVREPQLHHRQQAVSARDDARLGAEPLQRCDRALDAGRALVLE